ncbi:hypothetical protein Pmani_025446 [Petrolisthes manimaculis]|uniref:Uncharacterized protein n=1 Tax=Petrolisthes manimaculis TaxID=1843537 RepID=A0AAE1TYX4_9EUCA|nr:hypothetical protein Pmani_025446 [Petrolisthes manimaculis]
MAADSLMDVHMGQEGRCPVNDIPPLNTTSTTPQQPPIQPQATQPDNSMVEILRALKENTQEIRGIIQQCVTQSQGQSLPLPPPPQYQPPPQDRRPRRQYQLQICSYHQYYGRNARNCRAPCQWASDMSNSNLAYNQGNY